MPVRSQPYLSYTYWITCSRCSVGEVDIDVGCARHLLVQEAFEEEVVLDGVDPRDAEHVSDDRVRRRAASLARHTVVRARNASGPSLMREESASPVFWITSNSRCCRRATSGVIGR